MASIKLTREQYITIRKPLPVRHIACQPRTPDYGVSQHSRRLAHVPVYHQPIYQLQDQPQHYSKYS